MKLNFWNHYEYASKYPGRYRWNAARRPRALGASRARGIGSRVRSLGSNFITPVPYRGDILRDDPVEPEYLTTGPMPMDLSADFRGAKQRLRRGDSMIDVVTNHGQNKKRRVGTEMVKATGKVGAALYGAYEGMKRLHPWGRMTPAQARKKYSNLMYYEEL